MLMNSKLPVDVLKNIWELSDVDKDGYLDRDEFCVVSSTQSKRQNKYLTLVYNYKEANILVFQIFFFSLPTDG